MKPFSPKEARESQVSAIPPEVFEAVNELLSDGIRGSSPVTIMQEMMIARILDKMPRVTRDVLFKYHWLDFESAYSKAGWHVLYDKPGYNEAYEASWRFTPKDGQ